jgi:hypothetical protein
MKYQLTILDGINTRFNEKYQDWSGQETSFDTQDTIQFETDNLTVDVLKKVINENYALELKTDDINLECACFNSIMDDENNCDVHGKNLVTYWFKLDKLVPVNLETLLQIN